MNYFLLFLLILIYFHFVFAFNNDKTEEKSIKVKGIKRSKSVTEKKNHINYLNNNFNYILSSKKRTEKNINKNHEITKKRKRDDENNKDVKCDITEFGECALAIDIRSAENQCNDNGKCPENLIKKYYNCFTKLYNANNDTPLLDQPYYQSINKIGLPFSFLCQKSGNKWCYDSYKSAIGNQTLLHEFTCSDCGSIAYSQYNLIIENKYNISEDHNNYIQQYIKEYNVCHMSIISIIFKIMMNNII
ncbi:hypothetical protein PIROE2DRAFT_2504 [Piromyces sp. E2]|nr:hypothetical protein PIROE2DRAFT_2504 [Piromyces sp. E2]|eukprot:OUM69635.1 hypothetical protein PIROE2DRAFT_2504 [Piromyces sp. E2]